MNDAIFLRLNKGSVNHRTPESEQLRNSRANDLQLSVNVDRSIRTVAAYFLSTDSNEDTPSPLLDSAMAGFRAVRAPVSHHVQQPDKSGGIWTAAIGPISDSVLQLAGARPR